jgi:hypothetical protein
MLRHRPAVLCVATTSFVRPGRSALGSLPVPWVDALWFVFLSDGTELGSVVGRVGLPPPGCWLRRSPCFRRLLPRRREALPSSRITLVPTCPALRPRWCPVHLPWRKQDCCLPDAPCCRLWIRFPELICGPPLYIFRSSMTRPVFSPPLCFAHCPFDSRTSVRLPTWWLAFGRVGLESSSHPLGNVDMFQEVSPLFPRPEFSSARGAAWFGNSIQLFEISIIVTIS